MLSPWLELPGAADRLAAWSTASGLDLARLGTTASTEEITDTAIAQPLIVAATLLAHAELTKRGLPAENELVVAGHSVGEIAAYAIAGVISADDAVALAATRGAEMAKACANEPTGMSAVLGGDEADVLARLEQLDLVPANRNAAGQIVAAGRLSALEKLAEDPPTKAPSTPNSWRPLSTATRRRYRTSRPRNRPLFCCPTVTVSRCPRLPTPSRSWSRS
jgi:[acyl-carrier-protein] S-malonyltransferase